MSDLTDKQRDGLRFLGELYEQQPALHPAVVLELLAELTDRLARCALSPSPDWRMHAELLRIGQTCVDAAKNLERYLDGKAPFTWRACVFDERDRLDDLERRVAGTERQVKALA